MHEVTHAGLSPEDTDIPPRTLTWRDGAAIGAFGALGLFTSAGYLIGAVGTWVVIVAFAGMALIGLFQNYLFAEMAAMFPDKQGGVSLFAAEGWRDRFSAAGPIGAFGYWMGYSFVLAIVGTLVGEIVAAQWFPDVTWSFSTGLADVGLPGCIGIAVVILSWVFNIIGIRVAATIAKAVGVFMLLFLVVMVAACITKGDWDLSKLSWSLPAGWTGIQALFVTAYVCAWTAYASEMTACFAPEYKNPVRDTRLAMLSVAAFFVVIYTIVPMATAGHIGEAAFTAQPVTYGIDILNELVGSDWGSALTACFIVMMLISCIGSSADASRALHGIAKDGMSLRQLDKLNRFGQPARALTFDLAVNIVLVLCISSPLAILCASNLGYLVSMVLANVAFLLLRKDRPDAVRPIRLSSKWTGVAYGLAAFNIALLIFGASHPDLAGYGDLSSTFIGIGILLLGLVLYWYRKLVQDRPRTPPNVAPEVTPVLAGGE